MYGFCILNNSLDLNKALSDSFFWLDTMNLEYPIIYIEGGGGGGLSGRVFDLRPRGRGFEPHRRHCVVSLSKNINPSLVLVHPRKTRPYITERLLMGRKESNQTNKDIY